jgi:hypothetical protein
MTSSEPTGNPTEQQIKDFVVNQCATWMAHDKEGYANLWKGFATKKVIFEDPVGTPPKVGWEQWSDMWDRFNPFTVDYRPEHVYVRGNEAAIAFYHKMNTGGEVVEIRDIEIWKFDNGTVEIRCWWDPPESGAHAESLAEYSDVGAR